MLSEVLRAQQGVVTRIQALHGGLSRAQVEWRLATGRWQRIFLGVYATFNGPVPRASMLWAVVLRAGEGAALSHETAAELVGLVERPARLVHVTVPSTRTPTRIPGVVIHRCGRLAHRRHPNRTPPQTRVEETVVDLTQTSRHPDDAVAWLARAIGARHTTPDRIAAALRQRPKLRSRALLTTALSDVAGGCHSLLELKYLWDVERAHRLPQGRRQARRAGTTSRYDDVRYEPFRITVELDGRAAHPEDRRWRDMRRDNTAVLNGDRVLRYGLADIVEEPCAVAAQVATVLRAMGWTAHARRCRRPGCMIA